MIEIFEDDAGVVIGAAVLDQQYRNFAERILQPYAVLTSPVSAGSTFTSLSNPSKAIAIRILRPNGEAGDERSIIMEAPSLEFQRDRESVCVSQPQRNGKPFGRAPHGSFSQTPRSHTAPSLKS